MYNVEGIELIGYRLNDKIRGDEETMPDFRLRAGNHGGKNKRLRKMSEQAGGQQRQD